MFEFDDLPPRYVEPLLELERRTMSSDWFETFGLELEKAYFLKVTSTNPLMDHIKR